LRGRSLMQHQAARELSVPGRRHWLQGSVRVANSQALGISSQAVVVPLSFFTRYSNRQLHARVKLADAFTGKFHSGHSCPVIQRRNQS
jgi:hypothetical protein